MSTVRLDFYGYKVFIEDRCDKSVPDRIRNDFSFFVRDVAARGVFFNETTATNSLFIEIINSKNFNFSGLYLGKTKLCRVKQASLKKRVFSYYLSEECRASAAVTDNLKNKTCTIDANNPSLAFEIAYLLILSSVGENLESRGLMRIHASSCLFKNKSFCFWGKRRAGKSTLILNLLQHIDLSVYSDENTLYDLNTDQIQPFPIRMSIDADTNRALQSFSGSSAREDSRCFLDNKLLVDIPINRRALPRHFDFFYILGHRNTENKVVSLGVKNYFFLFIDIVLGVGIIQMAEFLLRPTNIPTLFKILLNRVRLYFKIVRLHPQLWERSSSIKKNTSYCIESILNKTEPQRDIS